MRKWLSILLTMLLIPVLPASAEEESTVLTGKTAAEIVEMMGFGWNLGNTLDATGGNTDDVTAQEQSWGNAKITPELMVRVKEAGFDTIRIPVTWYRYTSDDGTYTIREDFLQHIREVVTWAREADLFVILNMHHEAWINEPNFAADAEKIGEQLTAMWRQIADTFADFDQHVIFEGMNEPRAGHELRVERQRGVLRCHQLPQPSVREHHPQGRQGVQRRALPDDSGLRGDQLPGGHGGDCPADGGWRSGGKHHRVRAFV